MWILHFFFNMYNAPVRWNIIRDWKTRPLEDFNGKTMYIFLKPSSSDDRRESLLSNISWYYWNEKGSDKMQTLNIIQTPSYDLDHQKMSTDDKMTATKISTQFQHNINTAYQPLILCWHFLMVQIIVWSSYSIYSLNLITSWGEDI